jgi:hypothetical protein
MANTLREVIKVVEAEKKNLLRKLERARMGM